MTSSLNEELKEQESLLAELIQQRDSSDEFASHIKSLRDVLIATENEIKDGVIDKTFINKYIDKIYVTPVSETEMRLEIKIFTGETTEKYFQKLCSRTGHTSKMMKPHDEVYNSSGYRFALLDGSMNNVGFRFFGIDGLDFYDGVLTNFRLTDVNFCNAFLFDTWADHTRIYCTRMCESVFRYVEFDRSTFSQVTFRDCNFTECDFTGITVDGIDVAEAITFYKKHQGENA